MTDTLLRTRFAKTDQVIEIGRDIMVFRALAVE
jgi:hypothetical protein